MLKNFFCWEGGIRTPELRREQIYSLSPLTTRPPPNFVSPREHESNVLSPFAHVLTVIVFIGFFRPPCHSLALTLSVVHGCSCNLKLELQHLFYFNIAKILFISETLQKYFLNYVKELFFSCRPTPTRTRNNGFGDRHDTISPWTCVFCFNSAKILNFFELPPF